jgi:hypothetical protein
MLSSADVQRYARQILIPQVGRLGQERWLAARVEAAGAGRALDAAVELLTAAGVPIDHREVIGPIAGDEAIGRMPRLAGLLVGETAFADSRAACEACLSAFFAQLPLALPDEAMAAAFAAGAGAAAEVLLLLLDPARSPIAMTFVPEPRRVSARREGCSCGAHA